MSRSGANVHGKASTSPGIVSGALVDIPGKPDNVLDEAASMAVDAVSEVVKNDAEDVEVAGTANTKRDSFKLAE